MKTTLAKKPNETDRKWYLVDATDKTLGRLAVTIAAILRGRHKPTYTPNTDTGDYVVVINADKVAVSGAKETGKTYMFYTGWVGTKYHRSVADMRARRPEFLITHAVKGMLPHNRLANAMIKKLKVYAGAEHPHAAQNPVEIIETK
ncbi:MAG: 50S ribosomal protein L13 [Opitutales bacterium]|nr:50S ribosomal protein L13 [Opitutales bacterium]